MFKINCNTSISLIDFLLKVVLKFEHDCFVYNDDKIKCLGVKYCRILLIATIVACMFYCDVIS